MSEITASHCSQNILSPLLWTATDSGSRQNNDCLFDCSRGLCKANIQFS